MTYQEQYENALHIMQVHAPELVKHFENEHCLFPVGEEALFMSRLLLQRVDYYYPTHANICQDITDIALFIVKHAND